MASISDALSPPFPELSLGGGPREQGPPSPPSHPLTFPRSLSLGPHPHAHCHTLSQGSSHPRAVTEPPGAPRVSLGPVGKGSSPGELLPSSLPTPTQMHHDQLVAPGEGGLKGEAAVARWAPCPPLPLIKTNPRPRSRSSRNPGGHHPDQKPRKNQSMSKACMNEGGDP